MSKRPNTSTECRLLALLDALAAHQFGRNARYSGHASDIGNRSKMTPSQTLG